MTVRRLGPAGPLAFAAAVLPPIGGLTLLATGVGFAHWFQNNGVVGIAAFIAILIIFGGLAMLPTYAQALFSGWLFGVVGGLPAAVVGFMGAAALSYSLVRRYGGDGALRIVDKYPRAGVVYRALAHGGFRKTAVVVALLRLPPASPFALTNVMLSALGVSRGAYLLGSFIGLSPRVAAAVVIGASLSDPYATFEGRPVLTVLGVISLVVAVVVLGWMARRALATLEALEAVSQPVNG